MSSEHLSVSCVTLLSFLIKFGFKAISEQLRMYLGKLDCHERAECQHRHSPCFLLQAALTSRIGNEVGPSELSKAPVSQGKREAELQSL